MQPVPLEEIADAEGVLLRRTAVAAGHQDRVLYRAVQAGRLVRVRQGAYVLAPVWRAASDRSRQLLLIRAVVQQYPNDVVVSHCSAAVLYGAPDWGMRLDEVSLTHLDGVGERRRAKVRHHRGTLLESERCILGTTPVTAPTRTAMDAASMLPFEPAVAVLDWFLHEQLTTREELEAELDARRTWPSTLRLRRVVAFSSALSESVGETRSCVPDSGVTR